MIASNAPAARLEACLEALERPAGRRRRGSRSRGEGEPRRAAGPVSVGALHAVGRARSSRSSGATASRSATGDVVAFTIAQMVPAPDWIAAIRRADRRARGRRRRDRPRATASASSTGPSTSAATPATCGRSTRARNPDLPGDNVVFSRRRLEEIAPALETGYWEPVAHPELERNGVTLWQSPELVVHMGRSAGFAAFVRQRLAARTPLRAPAGRPLLAGPQPDRRGRVPGGAVPDDRRGAAAGLRASGRFRARPSRPSGDRRLQRHLGVCGGARPPRHAAPRMTRSASSRSSSPRSTAFRTSATASRRSNGTLRRPRSSSPTRRTARHAAAVAERFPDVKILSFDEQMTVPELRAAGIFASQRPVRRADRGPLQRRAKGGRSRLLAGTSGGALGRRRPDPKRGRRARPRLGGLPLRVQQLPAAGARRAPSATFPA